MKRTGIAICDSNEILASPVCVLFESSFKKCGSYVAQKAISLGAEMIIVGLPVNMDGSKGESAKRCEDFAKFLEEISFLPVKLFDERQTTMLAHTYLNNTNTRGQKRKDIVDAVSAVILLEDYLKYKANN
ncbi:hypothetical protein FACS1894132_03230 [Clostridia bacterium]|nr:hypothetical protein FACS1894132_03230 [Clostridia bacterium]